MRGLEGKAAVVTGGASGIGAAAVRRLREEGVDVVIADINEEGGAALAAETGAVFEQVDVSDEADVARSIDRCVEQFGRIDICFVNAAVFGAVGPISSLRIEDIDATIGVNLRGAILYAKHASRAMVTAGRGSIILTASPGALVGGAGPHVYAATKGGVISLARSIAAELRPHGVRINSLVPGAIASAMTADAILGDASAVDRAEEAMASGSMLGRAGVPADVVGTVAFLASDDAAYITGSEIFVDAGYTHASGSAAFSAPKFKQTGALYENGRRGSIA